MDFSDKTIDRQRVSSRDRDRFHDTLHANTGELRAALRRLSRRLLLSPGQALLAVRGEGLRVSLRSFTSNKVHARKPVAVFFAPDLHTPFTARAR